MKPRARRVTIAAAVLGAAVVGVFVFVVTNWDTVRDHLECWRFQLATETETIEPDPTLKELPGGRGVGLGFRGGLPHPKKKRPDLTFPYLRLLASHSDLNVILAKDTPLPRDIKIERVGKAVGIINRIKAYLEKDGWRVLEQRFPRRVYVVIREERKTEEPPPTFPSPGILLPPLLEEPVKLETR